MNVTQVSSFHLTCIKVYFASLASAFITFLTGHYPSVMQASQTPIPVWKVLETSTECLIGKLVLQFALVRVYVDFKLSKLLEELRHFPECSIWQAQISIS